MSKTSVEDDACHKSYYANGQNKYESWLAVILKHQKSSVYALMSQDRHRTIWTNMTLVFCFMIMFLCMRRKDMPPYILTILRKIFFARLISRYFPLYFFTTYICQLSSRLHKKFILFFSNDSTNRYCFQVCWNNCISV